MSVYSDTSKAVVRRLQDSGRFGDILIMEDRQKDFVSELEKVEQKITGNLILVTWAGAERPDKNANGPRFVGNFSVTLWSQCILADEDETPADDYAELICQLLDDYRPIVNGREIHMDSRWIVQGVYPMDHPKLLVHRIPVQIPIQLPKLPS
jgi:hypothetical protein